MRKKKECIIRPGGALYAVFYAGSGGGNSTVNVRISAITFNGRRLPAAVLSQ